MLGGKVAQGEVAQGTALRRPRQLNFYATRNFPPCASFPASTLWMIEQHTEAQGTERIADRVKHSAESGCSSARICGKGARCSWRRFKIIRAGGPGRSILVE